MATGWIISFVVLCAIFPRGSTLEAVVCGDLPGRQFSTTAAYDGDNGIYILGGFDMDGERLDQILKYNLTTEAVESVGRILVPVASATTQIDTQGNVFHFAGQMYEASEAIFKFSGSDERPIRPGLVGRLPRALFDASSGYDGQDGFYTFGGISGTLEATRDIIKYNSTTNEAEIVGQMPKILFATGAAWFQSSFYVFGGSVDYNTPSPSFDIFRHTPGMEDGIETLEIQLPSPFSYGSVLTVGDKIYLIGGQGSNQGQGSFVTQFDPIAQSLENLEVTNLPERMNQISSVYVPRLNRIYIIGGFRGLFEPISNEILCIDL